MLFNSVTRKDRHDQRIDLAVNQPHLIGEVFHPLLVAFESVTQQLVGSVVNSVSVRLTDKRLDSTDRTGTAPTMVSAQGTFAMANLRASWRRLQSSCLTHCDLFPGLAGVI